MTKVRVTINRASLRVDDQIARQINGNTVRTRKLISNFRRSGLPKQWAKDTQTMLNRLSTVLLAVFGGHATGIHAPVPSLFGVHFKKPWEPLSVDYAKRKTTDSYWFETGELLDYVTNAIAPLQGKQAVAKHEIKQGKIKRGDKQVRLSVLVTPAKLPEPFQSLIMYPFLQGQSNDLSGFGEGGDRNAIKLLVNQALRGFIPEISAEYGRQLIHELRR